MDGKAYCDDQTWGAVLQNVGADAVQLRDRQYDAVYHLVTAAKGAESFYGSETNAARRETPEEARELDSKTLNSYLGHPHLRYSPQACVAPSIPLCRVALNHSAPPGGRLVVGACIGTADHTRRDVEWRSGRTHPPAADTSHCLSGVWSNEGLLLKPTRRPPPVGGGGGLCSR